MEFCQCRECGTHENLFIRSEITVEDKPDHVNPSAFLHLQGLIVSLRDSPGLPSKCVSRARFRQRASGDIFGTVCLLPGLSGQFVHLVNLPLHSFESLLQSVFASIQCFSGQSISPSDLKPLETRKCRVTDQDQQADYLKPKFGVLPPFAGFLPG